MAADPPASDPRVIAAFLDDVDLELDAARRLVADPPNRLAAFHLQQAGEKLVKAVRLSRGLRVTADHDLEALIDELPDEDPWRAKLRVLEPLSAYDDVPLSVADRQTKGWPQRRGGARLGQDDLRAERGGPGIALEAIGPISSMITVLMPNRRAPPDDHTLGQRIWVTRTDAVAVFGRAWRSPRSGCARSSQTGSARSPRPRA